MCTGIVENRKVSGSGKGPDGWYPFDRASVSYDHPDHAQSGCAVIIDFLNEAVGPKARIAVELTPESARNLVQAILASLSRGEGERVRARDEPPQ
jgi:uncharacterized protein DUF6295